MLAHAFGQRYELPIPLVLFVLAGAFVVVFSFGMVVMRPVSAGPDAVIRFEPTHRLRPIPATLGVAGLLALVVCGVGGRQEVDLNIVPTMFWLVVWIAVPLSCGLLGDWTGPVNPFSVLASLADRPGVRRALLGGPDPLPWPEGWGWWPATALYFALACGELIFNSAATVPRNTAVALACYALVSVTAGMVFGPEWVRRGEVFSVMFATWGRLGYFRFGASGRAGFTGGLRDAAAPAAPAVSRLAFTLLLLISVNFDGLLATPAWGDFERRRLGLVAPDDPRLELLRLVAFVVLAAIVWATFAAFAVASVRISRCDLSAPAALTGLVPSLVPIAFGYLLAHNLSYLLANGQLLATLLGNPTGTAGWPALPYPFDGRYQPVAQVLPNGLNWYLAVIVIVGVHVLAVVLAHRHLGRAAGDPRRARLGELPWLVAMVGYTVLSLWLLAQPLVQEVQ